MLEFGRVVMRVGGHMLQLPDVTPGPHQHPPFHQNFRHRHRHRHRQQFISDPESNKNQRLDFKTKIEFDPVEDGADYYEFHGWFAAQSIKVSIPNLERQTPIIRLFKEL